MIKWVVKHYLTQHSTFTFTFKHDCRLDGVIHFFGCALFSCLLAYLSTRLRCLDTLFASCGYRLKEINEKYFQQIELKTTV